MDWTALFLSLSLAGGTSAALIPLAIVCGRALARAEFAGKGLVEALIALPLVLPPTVVGFYLLSFFGAAGPVGAAWRSVFGSSLVFTFEGLLLASVIVNIPFALQPIQRGFEAIPRDLLHAAASCGLAPHKTFLRIELPLAWPSILTALVLVFAHTLGEFGVVLMMGGAIPGETKTLSIAIYDRVQAFDDDAAAGMAGLLLVISLGAIGLTYALSRRFARHLVQP